MTLPEQCLRLAFNEEGCCCSSCGIGRDRRQEAKRKNRLKRGKWGTRRLALLIKMYGTGCYSCPNESEFVLTVDHVVPRSKGGTNALENTMPACYPCNGSKADSDAVRYVALAEMHRGSARLVGRTG